MSDETTQANNEDKEVEDILDTIDKPIDSFRPSQIKDYSFLYGQIPDEAPIDDNSIYLSHEQRALHKTNKLRELIVDNKIKQEGLPTKSGDMRVINEMLNSIDTSVHNSGAARLKQVSNDTDKEAVISSVAMIINKLDPNVATSKDPKLKGEVGTVSDKELPDDLVEDETLIGIKNIDQKEFMKKMEENKEGS